VRRTLALFGALVLAAGSGSWLLGAQGPSVAPSLYADLTWRCTGPFDGGPVTSVQGVAGQPGVYTITTPSGGAWKTIDGGDTWAFLAGADLLLPAEPRRWVDPANARRIARVTTNGIEIRLDAGTTWTSSRHLPIAEVARLSPREHSTEPPSTARRIDGAAATVSIADAARPGLVFAGTKTGVFVSFDGGSSWASLRLNMPAVAINDLDLRGTTLVAATQGRSIWVLEDISLLRQLSASTAASPAMLFKPADATLPRVDSTTDGIGAPGVYLDYYLGPSTGAAVTLEVLDAAGRVVHHAQSAATDAGDRWLPVARALPASPGHHRVVWNLRFDPPPSPHHRFAQFARALFEDTPAEPDGPLVLAGAYRVRLTAGGRSYVQPMAVRDDAGATPGYLQARRRQFDLAMQAYEAMQVAHRGFLQLAQARAAIRPLLASADPDLAKAATDLDTRLNAIDGSDWTGLVIPDADNEAGEIDEAKEGKHPDFVPPKPVSLSKDYDDPTSILGRAFGNVTHAPAFAIVGLSLGDVVTKTGRESAAPDALALDTYAQACRQLAGVLDEWRAINAQDLPQLNADLDKRRLPRLPIAASVPTLVCR
jgi:hypothetical protein